MTTRHRRHFEALWLRQRPAVQARELADGKRSLKHFVELLIGAGFRIPAGQ
jgi:hypothetical protein